MVRLAEEVEVVAWVDVEGNVFNSPEEAEDSSKIILSSNLSAAVNVVLGLRKEHRDTTQYLIKVCRAAVEAYDAIVDSNKEEGKNLGEILDYFNAWTPSYPHLYWVDEQKYVLVSEDDDGDIIFIQDGGGEHTYACDYTDYINKGEEVDIENLASALGFNKDSSWVEVDTFSEDWTDRFDSSEFMGDSGGDDPIRIGNIVKASGDARIEDKKFMVVGHNTNHNMCFVWDEENSHVRKIDTSYSGITVSKVEDI